MVLKAQAISKRNKNTCNIGCIEEEDIREDGIVEGNIDSGKVLSTFIFGVSTASKNINASSINDPVQENTNEKAAVQTQTYSAAPKGMTPPINGEHYTVKRSYAMRPSTVRKLNELKAKHQDVNILFNTIVDMSISHYYDYIFNEKGAFDSQE